MRKICLTLLLCFLTTTSFAYPLSEKAPATESAPLNIFSSQPSKLFAVTQGTYKDKFLIGIFSTSTITLIDLDTFSEFSTSIDTFHTSVEDVALLKNGTTLILGLSDGNIATIELDDTSTFANTDENANSSNTDDDSATQIYDSRVTEITANITTPGINHMVADPDDNIIYMVNDSGFFFTYNVSTNSLSQLELTGDSIVQTNNFTTTSTNFIPTGILFAQTSSGDKILIPTTTGDVLTITPGKSVFSQAELNSSSDDITNTTPNFSAFALTPDQDYLYLIDSDNDVIWVYDIIAKSFKDQTTSGSSLDPIVVDNNYNSDFSDIGIFNDGTDTVAYVSGSSGITLIDANDPGSSSSSSKVLDADSATSGNENPISLSATPGPITFSSSDLGYIFTAGGNATISILTANPWISIISTSVNSVTETDSTFTVTFQSDTAGTFTVRVDSNPDGTGGTELISSTTINDSDINTDIVTGTIDINSFDRSIFTEGSNEIIVYVTDNSGNIGHGGTTITVDRPPEAVTISSTTFGSSRGFINFTPSADSDVSSYTLYAEVASDQSNPSCPGSLSFDSTSTVSTSFSSSSCSSSVCKGEISGLTNETVYCVAVKAIDNGGQESSLATFSGTIVPEQTVGPAGFLGQTSCALNKTKTDLKGTIVLLLLIISSYLIFRFRLLNTKKILFILFLSTTFMTKNASATELTPQNWTLEVRGSVWFPTDSGTRNIMGTCCNLLGEVEFGWLYKNQFNVTVTSGFGFDRGNAVGINSGTPSGDKYNLILVPMRLDFIYRFDYKSEQLLLPYVRAGFDAVYFRESVSGSSIQNVRFGLHGGAGLGILLDRAEQLGHTLEAEAGVNDVYLIIEARYALINNFSSTGLNLSGFYPYLGVLFEF